MATNYETEICTANTARGFVHAMPNVLNTRAEHTQASTPDDLLQGRKIMKSDEIID